MSSVGNVRDIPVTDFYEDAWPVAYGDSDGRQLPVFVVISLYNGILLLDMKARSLMHSRCGRTKATLNYKKGRKQRSAQDGWGGCFVWGTHRGKDGVVEGLEQDDVQVHGDERPDHVHVTFNLYLHPIQQTNTKT
jgi:hypothetical protein